MTEIEQVKALAELDGYDIICVGIGTPGCYKLMRNGECLSKHDLKKFAELHFLPYLTSYDAIIPLIQKQGPVVQYQMVDFLCELMLEEYDGGEEVRQSDLSVLARATPSNLCEALLRATNRWIIS